MNCEGRMKFTTVIISYFRARMLSNNSLIGHNEFYFMSGFEKVELKFNNFDEYEVKRELWMSATDVRIINGQ